MTWNQSDFYPKLHYSPGTQKSYLSHWRSAIKNTELVLSPCCSEEYFQAP